MKQPTKEELQAIYNQVWAGLKSQDFQQSTVQVPIFPGSDRTSPGCKFRGDCGRKCAVGWLIPDELYQPGYDTGTTGVREAIRVGLVPAVDRELSHEADLRVTLLQDLMSAHDGGEEPEQMQANLKRVADVYGLEAPEGGWTEYIGTLPHPMVEAYDD